MSNRDLPRRALLKGGGAALAGLSVLRVAGPAHAFPGQTGQRQECPGTTTSLTPCGPSSPWWAGDSMA